MRQRAALIVGTQTNDNHRGETDPALQRFTHGLGNLSLVLGLTEMIWGGALSNLLGLAGYHGLIRLYGAGQVLSGLLILNSRDAMPWVWLRVAADALHLGTFIYGYTRDRNDAVNIIIASVTVLAVAAADLYCAVKLSTASKLRVVR